MLYPKKKVGKGQARERWHKMTADERVLAVEGIRRHVDWWVEHTTDAQFIPTGNVWLNQRRWEDEEPRSRLVPVGKPSLVERARARRTAQTTIIDVEAR